MSNGDDVTYPVEEQFILRLPERAANVLRENIANPPLTLTFTDKRRAQVRVGDVQLKANLVNLPCIIESYKTMDNKQFYKTADVSQMLVATEPNAADVTATDDGISPPLKNVRNRRFRKMATRTQVAQEIEQIVAGMLEEDAKAESVEYTFVNADDMASDSDDSDFAAEIEANLDEDDEEDKGPSINEQHRQTMLKELKAEIDALEERIRQKRALIDETPNRLMRERFEDALEKLQMELAERTEHYAEIDNK